MPYPPPPPTVGQLEAQIADLQRQLKATQAAYDRDERRLAAISRLLAPSTVSVTKVKLRAALATP